MLKIAFVGSGSRWTRTGVVWAAVGAVVLWAVPCRGQQDTKPDGAAAKTQSPAEKSKDTAEETKPAAENPQPSPSPVGKKDGTIDADAIPRFGENSPFSTDYQPPVMIEGKRLWAKSFRWSKAPEFVVEKWLTEKPEMKGKYVLIQFWATWCGPCRRSIPLLNGFHKKYGKELVVVGVSEEAEEDVRKMEKPKIEYYVAVDTQKRMKDELGVFGIPHVIIVEPDGYVIWEGFPLQEHYELSEAVIEKILEVGRKLRAEQKTEQETEKQ